MAPERSSIVNGNQLKNASNILTSGVASPFAPAPQPIQPPPLPPRQPVQNYSGYNDCRPFGSNYYGSYGNQYRGFGGYGSSSYAPYSNYSNYGGIGGHSGDVENRFFQYAEESTRSTFRLVETVLQTFSSMTMLLESTYFALTNSFRAILSVAENIGKLRSTIGQLFSTFALIRFVKWLYKKIASTMGFQQFHDEDSVNDKLWEKSLSQIKGENLSNSSFWSGILFFSVFFVIPYMIHKISQNVKQIQTRGKNPKEWCLCEEPVYVATVLYDFIAANDKELSIKAGQKICLAPQSLQPKNLPGWCIGTDNVNVGLVPHNYIKIVGQLKKRPADCENTPNERKDESFETDCQ